MRRAGFFAISVVLGVLLLCAGGCGGAADQVRFQNASNPGPDPFTPPTDVPKGGGRASSTQVSNSPKTGDQAKPGAFTKRNTVCDREKLIAALAADTGKLKAWADAAGVDPDVKTVAKFIRGLKPSTLVRDTQVTSHSYSGGEAKEYQAILPKGTAVLVDSDGQPVARCVCGNPLSAATDLAKQTKCIDCPPNYQPPPKCNGGGCATTEPNPPRVKKPTDPPDEVDTVASARVKLDACRKAKGSLQNCATEYEKARKLCTADPLNPVCDSSVCFDSLVLVGSSSCSSLLDNSEARSFCAVKFPEQVQSCIETQDALRKRCVADPTQRDCRVDPGQKATSLRFRCIKDPTQPECGAIQLGCAKNPNQIPCDKLRTACTNDPNRPDCKAAQQQNTGTPKLNAPNLAQDQQQGDQQNGAQGTDQQGGDTGGGEGSGGGQEPQTPEPQPQQPDQGQQPDGGQ